MADACRGVRRVDNAAPEQMPNVRRDGVDFAAVTVDRERERLAILEPEVAIEARFQLRRLPLEALRERRVVPEGSSQAGGTDLGIVDVALDLARRPRQLRHRAVGEEDRVPGVFPALVLEPGLHVALVLDVAVAIAVAVGIDPVEGRARLAFEVLNECAIAGPAFGL